MSQWFPSLQKTAMRMLLVEDEKKLSDLVARALRAERYAVDVADDGPRRMVARGGLRLRPDHPGPDAAGPERRRSC